MPLFDKDGNEVPGSLTPQEAEVKIKEVQDATRREVEAQVAQKETEYKSKLEEAQTELENAKAALNAAGDKDQNFAALRKQKEDADAKVKQLEDQRQKDVDEIRGIVNQDRVDTAIESVSGGDKELKDKIAANYKLINLPATTPDEIKARVAAAYKMSVDSPEPNVLSRINSGPASNPVARGSSAAHISEDLKSIAGKFGLSNEDLEKYTPKN